jgi:hypothetical protein
MDLSYKLVKLSAVQQPPQQEEIRVPTLSGKASVS